MTYAGASGYRRGHRVHKCIGDGRLFATERPALMLEKSGHKERVRGKLHAAEIAFEIANRGLKSTGQKQGLKFRIHAEVAVISFRDALDPISTSDDAAGRKEQLLGLFHQ
jgi:hypothetical protein